MSDLSSNFLIIIIGTIYYVLITSSFVILAVITSFSHIKGSPRGSVSKESACNAGDSGLKGMATHSSILVWRIPWTEEPGELQSMGSQTVGHD